MIELTIEGALVVAQPPAANPPVRMTSWPGRLMLVWPQFQHVGSSAEDVEAADFIVETLSESLQQLSER